ncbi:ABC transporter substrate-binding protein [Aquabacter spiritensis]|uniref:ABC-type nitrate/sulfonate/bicarbonate transport system substrate-binding protein n=1 Tax=Aquabacter spiritensis TaxID=933073 RepID=A0A4V2UXI0_9HYPH|nr:ABC transporter substrate-binding protein [Aquabacter spiritensis]TCT03598.1 ABC-type nitrate/sulfonate/bicarbonate transport system substrate-binding protein [Aquabacter spiritensis]
MSIDRRAFLAAAGGLGVAGAFSIGTGFAIAQGTAPVRLGEAKGAGQSAEFVLASHDGLFKKRGLDVTLSPFGSGAAMGPALVAGSLDIIATGDVPGIPLMSAMGGAIKALCPLSEFSADQAIVVGKKIKQPQDLKGAKIALYKGSVATLLIERYAAQNGLKTEDITLIHMDPVQQPPALANGDIDGYVSWEPHIWSATKRFPESRVLARGDEPKRYISAYNLLLVREPFLKENRETVKLFVAALVEALEELNKDPNVANRTAVYIRDILGVDIAADVLAVMMKRRKYTMSITPEFIAAEKVNTDFLFDLGRLKTKPDIMSWLDPSVLREVRPDMVTI